MPNRFERRIGKNVNNVNGSKLIRDDGNNRKIVDTTNSVKNNVKKDNRIVTEEGKRAQIQAQREIQERRKQDKINYNKYVIPKNSYMNNDKFIQLELMKLKIDMMKIVKKLKNGGFINEKKSKDTNNKLHDEKISGLKKEIDDLLSIVSKQENKIEDTSKTISKNVQSVNEELYKSIQDDMTKLKKESQENNDKLYNKLKNYDVTIEEIQIQSRRFNKAILKINEVYEKFSEIESNIQNLNNNVNKNWSELNKYREIIEKNKVLEDELEDVNIIEFKKLVHSNNELFTTMRDDFSKNVSENKEMKAQFENIKNIIDVRMDNFDVGIKNVSQNYYFIEDKINGLVKESNDLLIKFKEIRAESNELKNTVEYRIALIDGKKPNKKDKKDDNDKVNSVKKPPLVGLPLARILESRKFNLKN